MPWSCIHVTWTWNYSDCSNHNLFQEDRELSLRLGAERSFPKDSEAWVVLCRMMQCWADDQSQGMGEKRKQRKLRKERHERDPNAASRWGKLLGQLQKHLSEMRQHWSAERDWVYLRASATEEGVWDWGLSPNLCCRVGGSAFVWQKSNCVCVWGGVIYFFLNFSNPV